MVCARFLTLFLCLVVLLFWFWFQVIQCLLKVLTTDNSLHQVFRLLVCLLIEVFQVSKAKLKPRKSKLTEKAFRFCSWIQFLFAFKLRWTTKDYIICSLFVKTWSHYRYHEKQNQRKWSLSTGSVHPWHTKYVSSNFIAVILQMKCSTYHKFPIIDLQ